MVTVAFFGLACSRAQLRGFPLTSQNRRPVSGTCSVAPCLCSGWWWEQLSGDCWDTALCVLLVLLKFSVISTLIVVGSSYFPKSYCCIPIILKAECLTQCFMQGSWYEDLYWFQSCKVRLEMCFCGWGKGEHSWTCLGANLALLEGKGGSTRAILSSCGAYKEGSQDSQLLWWTQKEFLPRSTR